MRTLALMTLAVGCVVADFGNDPPVPARKPVWYTGHWDTGIEIEIVYDLMCPDSASGNPPLQQFLDMPFDNTPGSLKVRDRIQLSYSFLPLPYHHEVWIPHTIVPSLLDQCLADSKSCIFYDYMDFCFQNQDFILTAKDTSQDDLIKQWTKKVADQFHLNQQDLLALYSRDTDKHNSEMRTRYMYKYNAHHHVSGTPFAIVNGIILQDFPTTANDWMDMLTTIWSQTNGGIYYRR
eukprot:403331970